MRSRDQKLDLDIEGAKRLKEELWNFATWSTTPQGLDYWKEVVTNVEALIEQAQGKNAVEEKGNG